jgi:PPM family protein phosphatase
MSDNPTGLRLEAAAVTDRGLNERRPLNEDSMLSDPGRHIFAVADGVGGAEAGEVASQTAIEVLNEAFLHHTEGDDAEDLMEIAIQRANDSIYRLSREQPRFSMMATTIVALYVDGLRATVGHVGDSRLYRLTPEGELRRETEDHSLVEEEVRAGRMTAQQAANHPSRNVISRALGAESAVEVDLRTFEFESGSTFLLCSDGITRHIPDGELSELLASTPSLEDACAEMKRLCYERGAEDNLTAVLVRVGGEGAGAGGETVELDEAPTLVTERGAGAAARSAAGEAYAPTVLRRPFNDAGPHAPADAGNNAAPVAPAPEFTPTPAQAPSAGDNHAPAAPAEERRGGGAGRVLGVLFLLAAVGLAAFYGGLLFGRRQAGGEADSKASNAPAAGTPAATQTPAALAAPGPAQTFDQRRRAVDLQPAAEASRMSADAGGQPLNSDDPEFLYLYGRAMLLTDRQEEAVAAFNRAVQRIEENMTPANGQLKIDTRLATIAAHLRAGRAEEARGVAATLDEMIRREPPAAESPQPMPGTTP